MFTDVLLDIQGQSITSDKLYKIFNDMIIPLVHMRITDILKLEDVENIWDDIMIELELCISLIFKPFLHYLQNLSNKKDQFLLLWKSILDVMTLLLDEEENIDENITSIRTLKNLLLTTKELGSEHLRNAVMVLTAAKIITNEASDDGSDISSLTWNSIKKLKFCQNLFDEWRTAAETEKMEMNECVKNMESTTNYTEELFDDLVIVSEGGEDTCESS